MDLTNKYYTDEMGERFLPSVLYEFGKLALVHPEIMVIYSGMQIRYGEDTFNCIRELIEENSCVVPNCSRFQADKENLVARQSDTLATKELLDRKKEIILGRLNEITQANADFQNYLTEYDVDSMVVCAGVIKAKSVDVDNDTKEFNKINNEYNKYKDLQAEAEVNYLKSEAILKESSDKYNRLFDELTIKDLTALRNFCELDKSEIDTIYELGINSVNQNLSNRYGGKLAITDIKEKSYHICILLGRIIGVMLQSIDYIKTAISKDYTEINSFDAKVAKRYETILNNFDQFINGEYGMRYVLSLLPKKYKKYHFDALKLFNDYLKMFFSERLVEAGEVENQLYTMTERYVDPYLVALYGAINDLKRKPLIVSTNKIIQEENSDDDDLVKRLLDEATKRAE